MSFVVSYVVYNHYGSLIHAFGEGEFKESTEIFGWKYSLFQCAYLSSKEAKPRNDKYVVKKIKK